MNKVWLIRDQKCVAKKFSHPCAYEREWSIYRDFPQYTPNVVKLIPDELTIITDMGDVIDAPTEGQLREIGVLVAGMRGDSLHHRDLHPGNIMAFEYGVRFIDWETAIRHPGRSYDLCGPVDVPVPVQHGGLLPQWWESNDPGSIRSVWGVGIPEWVKQ